MMTSSDKENLDTLKASLAQYETQLSEIKSAIKSSSDESTKESLTQLEGDIQELINLTRENLIQLEAANKKEDVFEDELALFEAEIGNLEGTSQDEGEAPAPPDIQDELEKILGSKCQAPFEHFGETSYHNALVINVETPDEVTSVEHIMVNILFVNPIYKSMLPCPYFLEGECKFSADQCHFSHGHLVPFIDLKEYKEPDFAKIVPGCSVLAKMKDGLWKRAILKSRLDDITCSIKLESSGAAEMEIELQDVLPLENSEGGCGTPPISDSSSDNESNDETELEERKMNLINESLMNPQTLSALGAWEQYTKGIGSKLMANMGYVIGTGLGKNSDGLVDPVEAVVFPQGKSLDYCMKLKENAGKDKDLLKAEKRRRRQAAKSEKTRQRGYEREKQRGFFFSFLNDQLAGPSAIAPALKNNVSLKESSLHNLNVDSMKVGEEIKKVNKDVFKLKESLSRHASGSAAHSKISSKLKMAENELFSLQNRENNINKEKSDRKSREKMSVF